MPTSRNQSRTVTPNLRISDLSANLVCFEITRGRQASVCLVPEHQVMIPSNAKRFLYSRDGIRRCAIGEIVHNPKGSEARSWLLG